MERIIQIKGNVKYSITLDPGVWIFDDRRIDLTTYFKKPSEKPDALEEYTKAISRHWDREIIEGATVPPTLKSEKRYQKELALTGTFGIPFKPFLANAEPMENASKLIIETADGKVDITLDQAYDLILGFSENGKPHLTDGPVHVFFGDGSNQEEPIKHVKSFVIE